MLGARVCASPTDGPHAADTFNVGNKALLASAWRPCGRGGTAARPEIDKASRHGTQLITYIFGHERDSPPRAIYGQMQRCQYLLPSDASSTVLPCSAYVRALTAPGPMSCALFPFPIAAAAAAAATYKENKNMQRVEFYVACVYHFHNWLLQYRLGFLYAGRAALERQPRATKYCWGDCDEHEA